MRGIFNNLKGQRFGRLLVKDVATSRNGYNVFWLCLCDCGKQKVVCNQNLKTGVTKSCGCLAKELSSKRNSQQIDITGKKYNKLTAIKFIRKEGKKHIWLFRCDCGKEKEMIKRNVTAPSSQIVSCGCYSKQILSERWKNSQNPRWKGGITPLRIMIRTHLLYKEWRREVLRKDNYTCQMCFKRGGHNLEVDHIKPFYLILKENKIDSLEKAMNCVDLWLIENGRVLCRDCHKKTDTYCSKVFSLISNNE